jgi:BirA family biotin operon repressor/biotin-[acetyl-CoA-carboxylase] ligase
MAFALGPDALARGYALTSLAQTASTNADGLAHLRGGGAGARWFATAHQTAGRGRRARAWIAPSGNLAASVTECVAASPAVTATLGFAAGVALTSALSDFGVAAALKWPNDVLLDGGKLAGILLEAEAMGEGRIGVVVGIGVNAVAAPEGLPYAAASLAGAGYVIDAETLFGALSDRWAQAFALWDGGRGMAAIRSQWLARAAGLGRPVSVQAGARTIEGIFDTLDDDGHLVVATAGGARVRVASGEVYFGAAQTQSAGAA